MDIHCSIHGGDIVLLILTVKMALVNIHEHMLLNIIFNIWSKCPERDYKSMELDYI